MGELLAVSALEILMSVPTWLERYFGVGKDQVGRGHTLGKA